MKKSIMAFFAAILMISLVGCNGGETHNHHKEIYKRYSNIDSFYAEVRITVKNETTESSYLARQFFEKPDRISFSVDSPEEVAGSGYTFKDGKYRLISGFGEESTVNVLFPNEKSTVFLNDFFENYYKSEDASLRIGAGFQNDKTTLSSPLSGASKKHFMQSLEVDNNTYLPLKLHSVHYQRFYKFLGFSK